MDWFSGIVLYILVWWVMFFVILPIRVTGQHETGEVVEGSEPGAPANAQVGRKALYACAAAAVVWVILAALISAGVVDLERLPGFTPETAPTDAR